jgi:hypothetical protein
MLNTIEGYGAILLMIVAAITIGIIYYFIGTNLVNNDNSKDVRDTLDKIIPIGAVLMGITMAINTMLVNAQKIRQETVSFYMSQLGFTLSFIAISISFVNVTNK